MIHLIDKDALVTEIEKRINFNGALNAYSRLDECYAILSILDTLEVKEVDFEREMQAFAKIYLEPLVISDSNIGISITMSQLYGCAKHFFKLGLKAQKGEEV